MKRFLGCAVAMFFALVAIALVGGDSGAVAGHGCHGRHRCHGRLAGRYWGARVHHAGLCRHFAHAWHHRAFAGGATPPGGLQHWHEGARIGALHRQHASPKLVHANGRSSLGHGDRLPSSHLPAGTALGPNLQISAIDHLGRASDFDLNANITIDEHHITHHTHFAL